jgi:hypothetical protein
MSRKDNLVRFPNPGADHEDDDGAQKSPDPQELQRAFGQLINALSSRPKARTDREIRIRNFRSARFELTQDLIVVRICLPLLASGRVFLWAHIRSGQPST